MDAAHVTIIRSENRKKTISAKMKNGKLWIYLPANLTKNEEVMWVERMKERFEKSKRRQSLNSDSKLQKRSYEINKQYFDNCLDFNIKYVTNQNSKFGSCTPKTKTIRISDRVADMPRWVQDYVIIHELTHLIHPDHSKKFWEKVNRYKYSERAKGYLIAVGMLSDDEK